MIARIIEIGHDYVAVECKQGEYKVRMSPIDTPKFSVGERVIFGPSELHEMVFPVAKPVTLKSQDPDGNTNEIQLRPSGIWGIPDSAPEYTSDGQHRDSLRPLRGMINKLPRKEEE